MVNIRKNGTQEIDRLVTLISVFIVSAICLWSILWRNSSILITTLYRGDSSKKRVALTFDDGPDPRHTPQVLDMLRCHNVKATFFCVGRLAEMHPEIVERIHKEGHLVANHSYEHSWRMYLWLPHRVQHSIVTAGYALQRITGSFPRFYRPPVGIKTPPQALVGWRLGITFVGWSRWAVDGGYRTLTGDRAQELAKKARNGDVFLLHDGKLDAEGKFLQNGAHKQALSEYLPVLIKGLQARNYELATLDELFGLPGCLETAPETLESAPAADTRSLLKALGHAFLHEHSSPANISLALALGILIGCSPFFGAHALLGLIIAYRFRLNKLATFVGTNISNPVTGPFVILASIQAGWLILTGSWLTYAGIEEIRAKSIWYLGNQFFKSWLIGFPIVGTIIGIAAMAICYPILRTWQAVRSNP